MSLVSAPQSPSLSEALALFARQLTFADLPEAVVSTVRLCLLHQLGMGLAAHSLPCARWVAELVEAEGSSGPATLLLGAQSSSVMNAAFANAALFHARVQDDTHHTAHLGTMLIATGLAVAQAHGCSGKDLLVALAAGYEVAGALSREYTALTTPRGFRASGVYGALGASVVAARLSGLDAQQTAHALGIAATLAGGTIEPFAAGSEEFILHNAQAARNGVLAASLAQRGMCAARTALEGPAGFLQAFAGEVGTVSRVLAGLGQTFEILNVTFKDQPVCAGNQTPLRNAWLLAEQIDAPEQVVSIEIEMNPYEARHPGIAYYGPFSSRVQTLMSTPFCVALGLSGRPVDMAALHDFTEPSLLRLVGCSRVLEADDLAMLDSRIRVGLADGRQLQSTLHAARHRVGFDWASEVQLLHRMREQMPLSAQRLEALVQAVSELEQLTDLEDLVGLACAPRRAPTLNTTGV